ncbi:hypothetical protein C2G38_2040880 [Gigaspora rosea]|uniref:FAR1 domain-containing protein n=1 Tax=Gigaspora rosea TaxID=44941 RepID=A0A397UUS8_9GLOM|nr:hypothetical protein C2G38_2040880 [Gigaspora rosea]
MDPLQFEENGEGSSVSLRDNNQIQFFFENNLTGTELSSISSPYDSKMIEIFDENFSDEKDEELALKIYEGQTFQTWNNVETFLKSYGLEQGFSIRKKRTESCFEDSNQVIRKVSWECGCAGNYQPKKVLDPEDQRNRKSKCIGCKCHLMGICPNHQQ